VAADIQSFRTDQPAVSRFAAARLAGRIFAVHPGFQTEAGRLETWLEAHPEWREAIGRFATDPVRLRGLVHEALDSLRAFAPG
jgi:hypothetical protein